MCPVTPSSKPNLENKRNEAASRSLRCRRSSSTLANLGGPGNPGFLTGAVAMRTSKENKVSRAEYSTELAGLRCAGIPHGPYRLSARLKKGKTHGRRSAEIQPAVISISCATSVSVSNKPTSQYDPHDAHLN